MDGTAYRVNRERVISLFHQRNIISGFIIYEAPEQPEEPFSGSDLEFVQEALFSWLTGWEGPDSSIVIDLATGHQTLFIPEYTKKYEIWNGPIPTIQSIIDKTCVDTVDWTENREAFLEARAPQVLFTTTIPIRSDFVKRHPRRDDSFFFRACCIARANKSSEEITAMRRASELTGEAIKKTWQTFKWHEGAQELEVQAMFEYHGKLLGCKNVSFLTIVGSGQHSCYLHYVANTGKIEKDDMVLLDCGLFYQHYAGDITRTFPASGKFSDDQKLVYNALLAKQIELIEEVKPGVAMSTLQMSMFAKVLQVLKELKLVPESCSDMNYARFFCPHGLSHHIGCNVHDQCHCDGGVLQPDMVISIEPGIYFHEERLKKEASDLPQLDMALAMRYARSVGGIRIEDDVLVTETGFDVLSKNCPKKVEEIEALMAH